MVTVGEKLFLLFDQSQIVTKLTSISLKLSFVNVGVPNTNDPQHNGPTALNKGNAPILATAFTDVFQVFSAKKFPGVIESTELSRKFAAQGIKIPIRKDGKGKRGGDDSDEDED